MHHIREKQYTFLLNMMHSLRNHKFLVFCSSQQLTSTPYLHLILIHSQFTSSSISRLRMQVKCHFLYDSQILLFLFYKNYFFPLPVVISSIGYEKSVPQGNKTPMTMHYHNNNEKSSYNNHMKDILY
jgi:hypothetical protein